MATTVPAHVVPVPGPLVPEGSNAQPPGQAADHAELEMLQALLKLQQQATQTAMDQIEELRKQVSSAHFSAQSDIDGLGKKAPEIVVPNRPAFADQYWPAAPEEPPAIPPKYTGAAAPMITLAVALAIIVSCVVFWASSGNPLPWRAHPPVAPTASLSTDVDALSRSQSSEGERSTAFEGALADLNDSLALFPGKLPTDVLWEASREDSSCLLQWNGGYPSFLFGAGTPHPRSLAFAIDQCADAVRRLRSPNPR